MTLASCLLVLAGCASSNTTPGASVPIETVRVSGGGGGGLMTVETHPGGGPAGGTVGFPLDRVWTALRVAYDSLAIPVTTFDPVTHTIGNTTLRTRRRLGNVAMSKYLNCGDTQGGNSADSYELQISVVTVARPAQESGMTSVLTTVDASGRPITLASEYTHCTSKGLIESRIVELVNAQLNR